MAPLSRDHHVALVVARQLLRADADHAGPARERFVEFLTNHELAHFALEESVLLPALPADEQSRSLSDRVREDHEYLRAAMRTLQHAPQSASVERLHTIGARLRDHVRMEERELFPHLERSLDAPTLNRIGAQLTR